MVATCSVGSMMYVLPMLLGRTYDMQHNSVGIDIYDKKDIEDAKRNSIHNPEVNSLFMLIEESSEKRDFLGLSGELAIKVSSGLLDIRGAGEYLKDTSNAENSVEILIKVTFTTLIRELSPDAVPLKYWQKLDRKDVGTHVVTELTYGGEVYASVNFIALKSEYLEDIKAQVSGSISKSGAFDVEAQGELKKVAQNISSKAKMEIDYYGTVTLEGVPTTIDGLGMLIQNFKDHVEKINKGIGVPICAGFRALADFDDKFQFLKNQELVHALEQFNYLFDNLREAKSHMRSFVSTLPESVSDEYLEKLSDFSGRLTKTLNKFYEVIGNLNMEVGSEQLSPAEEEFDTNSQIEGDNRYTKEIKRIISEYHEDKEDPNKPRGVYVRWGKSSCGVAGKRLYTGLMASFVEVGIGSGTNYQCLPENPNLKVKFDTSGLNKRTTKLGGVRYRNMSMFHGNGNQIQDKVVPCVVCETPMRPSVKMFAGLLSCPGDWVQEYTGFLVSNLHGYLRSQHVCVDVDPDSKNFSQKSKGDPVVMPVKIGGKSRDVTYAKNASVTCSVCSK